MCLKISTIQKGFKSNRLPLAARPNRAVGSREVGRPSMDCHEGFRDPQPAVGRRLSGAGLVSDL